MGAEPQADDALVATASRIGESWAREYVRELRAQERAPIGGWPGTMREARVRIVRALSVVNRDAIENKEAIENLARVANIAARRGWNELAEPDPEV